MSKKSFFPAIILGIFVTIACALGFAPDTHAATSITISPLHQTKVLMPGEIEPGSFTVANPASNDETLEYEIIVKPFWTDDDNDVTFTAHEDYGRIADWITVDNPTGSVEPNGKNEVTFKISVPKDAPAGGQYATLIVRAKPIEGQMISQVFEMAHLVYAEVAGETVRSGEISDPTLPGFLLSGKITGGASVKNTGNVHSYATHTLRVFPLFSSEEVFTNEENPQENLIMPGGNRYTSISWDKTPSVGIFHVIYDVEFEGVKKTVDKYVIICPIWLLFLLVLALAVIIFKILSGRKKSESGK